MESGGGEAGSNNAGDLAVKEYAMILMNKFDAAVQCCDKSIKIQPNFVDSYALKGVALFMLGRRNEAMQCYDRPIELRPRSSHAFCYNGIVLLITDRDAV